MVSSVSVSSLTRLSGAFSSWRGGGEEEIEGEGESDCGVISSWRAMEQRGRERERREEKNKKRPALSTSRPLCILSSPLSLSTWLSPISMYPRRALTGLAGASIPPSAQRGLFSHRRKKSSGGKGDAAGRKWAKGVK